MPRLDPKAQGQGRSLSGIAASPGAAAGMVVLSAEAAVQAHGRGDPGVKPIMLVRKETSPEDVAGMHLAKESSPPPAARRATPPSSPEGGASPASSVATP